MSWSDLAEAALRIVLDTFGEPVLYHPRGDDGAARTPFALTGVFEAAHQLVDLGGETPLSSVHPTLSVALSDFPANDPPRPDDELAVADGAWRVFEVQPDGQGGALLILKRA